MNGQLHLVNALGMRMSVNVESEQDAFAKMRALGRSGWGPLEVPAGGFRLPLAMHEKFDWSLIGAFALEIEGEHGVMFQGQFYKQRVFEEQTKGKKLPASVKYSRGAKPTDPPHIIEGDEKSSFKYVTLITFRGNGKSIPQFEIPAKGQQSQPAAQQRQETQAAPDETQTAGQDDVLQKHIENIGRIIERRKFSETAVKRVVREMMRGATDDYRKIAKAADAARIATHLANAKSAAS